MTTESPFADIAPELSNDEAFGRYAEVAVAFMVSQNKDDFTDEEVAVQDDLLESRQSWTDDFLLPFRRLALLEDNGNFESPWAIEGIARMFILGSFTWFYVSPL